MASQNYMGYHFETDAQNGIVYMSIGGCILSYIAMVYNVIIFLVLCRHNLISPSTVLMQGLAIADFLTGFCSYGLEPLFQSSYATVHSDTYSSKLTLAFPYCSLYVYSSQLVDTFHLISVLLTTCLGVQKVIALKFPIFFRNNLKIRSAIVCCVICFTTSLLINVPRHFSVSFANQQNVSFEYFDNDIYMTKTLLEGCSSIRESKQTFLYATRYYPLVFAILLVVLSTAMCICVIYTVYKLCQKNFRKKNVVQRSKERRSALMITAVLIIFLLSEIPRLAMYGYLFFGKYLYTMLEYETSEDSLGWIVTDYRATMAISLKMGSDMSFTNLLMIVESLKLVSLIGCMSNFVIYLTMSKQLRMELRTCLPSTVKKRRNFIIKNDKK